MLGRKGETLAGWGRAPVVPGHEVRSEDLARIADGRPLSRGLGRSYGDSSLPAASDREVVSTVLADRILSFDTESGLLRAEAGLSLDEIYRLFLPRGWFVPVTPGTKFVTLGGMVAADVHGKNHHKDGCFGAHVLDIKLRIADGRTVRCSPTVERDLFRATIGGMGLTGHILEVAFHMVRVPSPWIWQESERIPNIEAFMAALKAASTDWPMTAGWIDCLSSGPHMGRGILFKSRWATPEEAPARPPRPKRRFTIPFNFPQFVLGPLSIRAFNTLFYWKHIQRVRRRIVHPEATFYPLDMLWHWNRMYGRRGLTQHQCVLPNEAGAGAARRFLEVLTARGGASFLCVIKDCGPEGVGMLSFPRPGISIALDIAVRKDTPALIDALNECVLKEGGRIYLAKDAFTRAEHYRAMDPRIEEFQHVRRIWDPNRKLRSAQSVRLFGDSGVRKVVLLGATKGLGRAVARQLAARGDALFLLGRDPADLAASARDIEIRAGRAEGSVGTAPCDLERPDDFAAALDSADVVLGGFDTVVVTAGLFATQDRLEKDPKLARRLLTADFANTVVFCEEARRRLLARGGGTLCVFSSVAGERGRKPVVLYGAAKAGLTHYLEGLDHKFHDQGLRAICVKPGFVKTGMTAGLPTPPFAGEPEGVARDVVRAIDRGKPVAYSPAIWRWIMLAIRMLPRFVMRKIGF